jgi:hypothetical protein
MAAAAILLPLLLVAAAEPARNRSVLRVDLPHTNTSQLSKLIDAGEALWGHRSGSAAEILVTDATQHRELVRLAARTGAKLSVVIGDVDDVIRSQKAARKGDGWHPRAANSSAERAARRDEYFLEYRRLDVIYEYLELLALEHPSAARYIPNLGDSYEGRRIPAIEIGGVDGGPAIVWQGGSHCREWVSHSSIMWMVRHLLETEDPAWLELIRNLRFIIIPVLNPDGYEWTWADEGDRLWRKNRTPNPGEPECPGTDLNRNWDDGHWGMDDQCASTNPCSIVYRGAGPFSEPEVEAVRAYLAGVRASGTPLVGGIDWHSFTQLLLRPYGWAPPAVEVPPNDDQQRIASERMSAAAEAVHGKYYEPRPATGLYPTCGTARDYFYFISAENDGIAYTLELRDEGQFGFLLPDEQIIPNAEEMVPAMYEYGLSVLQAYAGAEARRAKTNETK